MPLKFKDDAPEEQPSLWQRFKGAVPTVIRGASGFLGAEGGPLGALIGGGGEALAELAESDDWYHKNPLSLKRIGAEAAIGSVPLAKVFKLGKAAESAIKGGTLSGAGTALREIAAGEDISPKDIAISTGLGAGTGGLLGFLTKPRIPKPKPPVFEVVPTDQSVIPPRPIRGTGEPISPIESLQGENQERVPLTGMPAEASGRVRKNITKEKGEAFREFRQAMNARDTAFKAEQKAAEEAKAAEEIANAKSELQPQAPSVSESISAKIPGGRERMTTRFTKPKEELGEEGGEELGGFLGALTRTTKRGPKAKDYGASIIDRARMPENYDELKNAWLKTGATEEQAHTAAMRGTGPRPYGGPPPVGEEAGVPPIVESKVEAAPPSKHPSKVERFNKNVEDILKKSEAPVGEPITESVAPAIEEPVQSGIARFFKTPVDVLGAAYKEAKTAEGINPIAKKQLGVALQHEARKAGLPTRGGGPETFGKFLSQELSPELGAASRVEQPIDITSQLKGTLTKIQETPFAPVDEAVPAATRAAQKPIAPKSEDWVAEQLAEAEGLASTAKSASDRKTFIQRLIDLDKSSEKGEIDPALMARLGLTAGGALLGAATNPLGNRLASAMAGGALGYAAPSVFKKLSENGIAPERIEGLGDALKTPEGVREATNKIWKELPHWQRFSLLSSAHGVAANAFAGPFGSTLWGALEKGLSGDPRGWAALDQLKNPKIFMNEFMNSLGEAQELLGRAEGRTFSKAGSFFQRMEATPGLLMTAGDRAAVHILKRAGFSEEEARTITLTSEPRTALGKDFVNFGKARGVEGEQSTLAQLLLPFKRTFANIFEQGIPRTPGVGALKYFLTSPEKRAALRTMLVQQGIGSGLALGAYETGANVTPENASTAGKYVSNIGGQYSLPAGLGFAAGVAKRKGKSPVLGTISEAQKAFPLPTADPIADTLKWLAGENRNKAGQNVPPNFLVPQPIRAFPEMARDIGLPIGGGSRLRFRE